MRSVPGFYHLGGAHELQPWKTHAVAAGHGQDCTSIEARPEGDDGLNVPQDCQDSLPSLGPWRSIEEIGSGESMNMRESDRALNLD